MERKTAVGGMRKVLLGLAAAALLSGSGGFQSQADAQVRIMCLGDSLTSSISGYSSYRYWLYKRLVNAGYRIDFVGTMWGVGDGVAASHSDFDQDHEGHPGATTDDILNSVTYYAQQSRPQIVLLLIGGNDFEDGQTPSHAMANTRSIIASLRRVNPNVSILWGMLPPAAGQMPQVRAYNGGVLHYASMWSTRTSPIRVVDLFTGFYPSQDTSDGEHPNERGEKKFAARFYTPLTAALSRFR